MNYSVPKHLFKFNIDPTVDSDSEDEEDLVDSEEELDEEAEYCESVEPKRRRSENWSEQGVSVLGSGKVLYFLNTYSSFVVYQN